MYLPAQLAKHIREIHFGGNWTCSNLKDQLSDVTWQQATTQIFSLNTIVTLLYHISYYTSAVLKVLEGGPLDSSDKLSFSHPPIQSDADWRALLDKTWADAEKLAEQVEQLPEERLWAPFTDEKYGTYYRNIHGMVEHAHYHLGQIVLINKILLLENDKQ